MATIVTNGYPVFTGTDGEPLNDGYIFIGVAGLNPLTNPQAAYYDSAQTIPATGIRTVNGYPTYQGSPAVIYTEGTYSLLVQDSESNTVLFQPNAGSSSEGSTGVDRTALENDGGVVKVSVGSTIEANGEFFTVATAAATPSGVATTGAYLFFDSSSDTFAWSTTAGTFDAVKGGFYDVSDRRQCRFRLTSATTWEEVLGAVDPNGLVDGDLTVDGDLSVGGVNIATGVITTGTGTPTLRMKVLEIGDWNMDSTASVDITHGVTRDNVRGVHALIRSDNGGIFSITSNGSDVDGAFAVDVSVVTLSRVTSGSWDNTNFDSTGYNRGWVTIWYVE